MSVYKLIIIIFCFHIFSVFAGTIDCEPTSSTQWGYNEWSTLHSSYELKPSASNITLGSNIADWSPLYTLNNVMLGLQAPACSTWSGLYAEYVYTSPYTNLLNTVSGNKIYPTNVPGIGMSIGLSYGVGSTSKSTGPYPDMYYYGPPWVDTWLVANIIYWKVPGKIPLSQGPISIDGPEIGVVYYSATDTLTSKSADRIIPFNQGNGKGYVVGTRILHATLMFQPGTCNVEGDNVNVEMGNYDGTGGHSVWKDASFKLDCPDGYGYGGTYTSSDWDLYDINDANGGSITSQNNKSNGRVEISIVPYTETLDANRGIIGLDGTGAQGYGIQLAWGDYSTQNLAEPTNPVILNSYVDAHSLNAAFSADDTPIGGNGLVGLDNTIKMAARYIRTTGKTQPGPANAVVQVIASYQ